VTEWIHLWVKPAWAVFVTLLHVCGAAAVTLHAVLRKRDARAVIGWVGLAWLAPVVGSLAYVLLGINRIQRVGVALGLKENWGERLPPSYLASDLAERDRLVALHPMLTGLHRLGSRVTGRPLLPGNALTPLVNGDESYPAMLLAIESARESVALASYIFDNDRAGEEFLRALVRARDRGVEVRVLIDHVGSRYSRPTMIHRLRAEGIRVAGFLETRVPRLFRYANLRNHRKILVVDGRTGFTGGTNIREGHWLKLNPAEPVRCLHFRVEGPVVSELMEAFAIDWAFTTEERLTGAKWFPALDRAGVIGCRGVPDGPDEDLDKISEILLGGIAAATESVQVVTPYFLPDDVLLTALGVAAMRGVAVDIVLPELGNIPLADWASRPLLPYLLRRGCRVHLTPPPFDHTKLLVVDGVWSLIGSANLDPRSLRLNFEFNVECFGDSLGAQLDSLVREKIANARSLTLEEMENRPLPLRLRDGLARLLSPYL
jgi:cardiolipin synthase